MTAAPKLARPAAATSPVDPALRAPLDPDLPLRPNVGICLLDAAGRVFAGRAFPNPFGWPDPEIVADGVDWILPQGGIDPGEAIEAAARRELAEETGVRSARLVAITPEWWTYDFPVRAAPSHKLFPFRGQRQRWAIFRFEGDDGEVDVSAVHTHEPAEFAEWRWMPLAAVIPLAPLHRRDNYRRLADFLATMPGHVG